MASTEQIKSTNVRASVALRWARRGMGALQTVSPDAAARAAVRLFFRTQRRSPKPGERDILADASSFTIPFQGEALAAWTWGSGPTVLLVHGWNGRATQLGTFVDPLVASGFRVVAFDHVGHGASSGASTSLVQMAEALECVAKIAGAHGVIAHSLGAGAAVLAMHDGALAPERAVLVAPPLAPEPWFRQLGSALGLDPRIYSLARAELERQVRRTFEELHIPTLARSLRQPALIIHDRDDREVPLAAGEALSRAWPGSRLLVTAKLGHHRILRSPGVVESARRFLLA